MSVTPLPYQSDYLYDSLEIRDTSSHVSEIIDFTRVNIGTIYVLNNLDQEVDITLYGNIKNDTAGSIQMGVAFKVASADTGARFIEPTSAGWMPYMYVTASCSSSPTEGSITGILLGKNFSNPK